MAAANTADTQEWVGWNNPSESISQRFRGLEVNTVVPPLLQYMVIFQSYPNTCFFRVAFDYTSNV